MIIPGVKFGPINIGDTINKFPDAKLIGNLSLNQKLYEWNAFSIRTTVEDKVNHVCSSYSSKENYKELIKIGASFDDIISNFNLLYDEVEYNFMIENIQGLFFNFGKEPLSNLNFIKNKITTICVYDIEMDKYDDYFFERLTKENLSQFIFPRTR